MIRLSFWRHPDYYAGTLMTLIGLGAVLAGYSYQIGTLANVGPGFFPAFVGGLLVIVGVAIALTPTYEGVLRGEHALPDLRGAVCMIGGLLAFALLGVYGGLVPATFAVVFISAMGDRDNTILQAIYLSIAATVFSVVVFRWGLRLQLPIFTWP